MSEETPRAGSKPKRGGRTAGTKPPRPSSSAGPGYGGPAKGVRPAITAATQPTPEAKSAGKITAKQMAEMAAAHAEKVISTWVEVMTNPDEPGTSRANAAEKLANRAFGAPVQPITADVTQMPAPDRKARIEELLAKRRAERG